MPNHGNASNTSPKYSSTTKNNNNNKSTRVEGNYFDFSCASCIVENTELVFIRTSYRHTLKHYFSFTAEDFSLFELSEEECRESYRQGSSNSSGSGRAGSSAKDNEDDSHRIKKCSAFPFLFGTSFHRNSSVISDGDSSNELTQQRNVLPSEYKERFISKNKDKEECKRKKSPVVLIQVLMAEEKDRKDKDKNKGVGMGKGKEEEKKGGRDATGDAGTRSVSVCIEFSNITHKHNPQSNFIPKITRLLTLCPPSQIIRNREIKKRIMINREERNRVVEMCGTDVKTDSDSRVKKGGIADGEQIQPQSSSLQEPVKTTDITPYLDTENTVTENKSAILMDEIQSSPSPSDLSEKKKVLQFSMTKIVVRVHKLCVDYECSSSASTSSSSSTSTSSPSCSSMESRMLLSLGSMSLSTTIANNSNCYLFKVSVKDLVLHLSNHILRNPLFEQNPLNINGSRNMLTDSTATQQTHMVAIDGALQSGVRQAKHFTLDFDRFLDEHDLIQVVSVDDVTALVGFNPPKQSSGGVSEDLGPDSYSISHQKEQSDCDGEKEMEKKAEKGVGGAGVVDSSAGGEERKRGATALPTTSTSKSAARVGTTDTSVELTLGLCCVYVCMDSVDVLTVSMTVTAFELVKLERVMTLPYFITHLLARPSFQISLSEFLMLLHFFCHITDSTHILSIIRKQ
jgi:hypothetical protein